MILTVDCLGKYQRLNSKQLDLAYNSGGLCTRTSVVDLLLLHSYFLVSRRRVIGINTGKFSSIFVVSPALIVLY